MCNIYMHLFGLDSPIAKSEVSCRFWKAVMRLPNTAVHSHLHDIKRRKMHY